VVSGSWVLGLMGSWTHGLMDSWALGLINGWVNNRDIRDTLGLSGFWGSRALGLLGSSMAG
jgi:hypothetical protein